MFYLANSLKRNESFASLFMMQCQVNYKGTTELISIKSNDFIKFCLLVCACIFYLLRSF